MTDSATDGDSFHLRHRGRDYVFRLYFVDAAETNVRFPERNQAQAEAFDLTLTNTLRLGETAARFTTRFLRRPCTVVTRWENGLGAGSQPRFYALVFGGRTNLAAELVRQGLARVYGRSAPWPDAAGGVRLWEELHAAEREARRANRGAWGGEFRATPAGPPLPTPRLDLNHATFEELTHLPGIGLTLAKRIVAARPFRSVDDLDRVSGIGPGKLAALRELVAVGSRAPSKP